MGRRLRKFAAALATVVMAIAFVGTAGVLSAPWTAPAAAELPICAPGEETSTVAGSGTPAPLGTLQGLPEPVQAGGTFAGVALDAEQVEMAGIIAAVGSQLGISRRGVEIALAVAVQQSSLRPEATNGPWLGLFQQNPETYAQYRRTEPGGAAWMFYERLLEQVPGYDSDPRTNSEIGDIVQRTGTPERFAEYADFAGELAGVLSGQVWLAPDDATCIPAPGAPGGSMFDAGNIISDAVFYNTAAMTESQIREFIRAEGEGCVGGFCLKNLRVTTPDQPADQYCAEYRGGENEDAAAVLVRVSQACGINPQVMLTTLQKESSLLSRTEVSPATYDAAWGWHCPDTGPGGTANCDPAHAGFFNQGYGMAKQWARYRVEPSRYNYRAGETVDILWNVVESGCGSAPVTIQNTATASLYNYTPYQPNAAALASYPGVGDACSAYGNRNFFYLFRKYFGSTGGGTSTAVLANGPAVTIPSNQYVSAAIAGQTITAPNAAVAAGLAAGFGTLGLPYVWGGGGSGAGPTNGCVRGGGAFNSCGPEIGFDCSGLTGYVLGQAGFRIPGDSTSQRSGGKTVSWAEALPGDIVGFTGHVALYLGTFGGRPYVLEASWVGAPVHIAPLTRTDADARLYRYWDGPATAFIGVTDFSGLLRHLSASFPTLWLAPLRPGSDLSTPDPEPYVLAAAEPATAPSPQLTPQPWPAPVQPPTVPDGSAPAPDNHLAPAPDNRLAAAPHLAAAPPDAGAAPERVAEPGAVEQRRQGPALQEPASSGQPTGSAATEPSAGSEPAHPSSSVIAAAPTPADAPGTGTVPPSSAPGEPAPTVTGAPASSIASEPTAPAPDLGAPAPSAPSSSASSPSASAQNPPTSGPAPASPSVDPTPTVPSPDQPPVVPSQPTPTPPGSDQPTPVMPSLPTIAEPTPTVPTPLLPTTPDGIPSSPATVWITALCAPASMFAPPSEEAPASSPTDQPGDATPTTATPPPPPPQEGAPVTVTSTTTVTLSSEELMALGAVPPADPDDPYWSFEDLPEGVFLIPCTAPPA